MRAYKFSHSYLVRNEMIIYFYFFQLSSISSNVFCLVSGIHILVNNQSSTALNINMRNVWEPALANTSGSLLVTRNNIGVKYDIRNVPTHSTIVQIDIATPRVFVGNISDIITHGIGPKDAAKQAI